MLHWSEKGGEGEGGREGVSENQRLKIWLKTSLSLGQPPTPPHPTPSCATASPAGSDK